MGQTASSRKKKFLLNNEIPNGIARDGLETMLDMEVEPDYVTLMRVRPNVANNIMPTSPQATTSSSSIQNVQNEIMIRNQLGHSSPLAIRSTTLSRPRPITELRPRPASTMRRSPPPPVKKSNLYCDMKELMRAKSVIITENDDSDDMEENEIDGLLPEELREAEDGIGQIHMRHTNENNNNNHRMANNVRQRPASFAMHNTRRCNCLECRSIKFNLLNWMLPNCTRTNAERLLRGRPDGTFMVRKSEKFPGQYTLSFVCVGEIRHCLVLKSRHGFGLKEPYKYRTLQQLIDHFSRHSLNEYNWKLNTVLKYPVFA